MAFASAGLPPPALNAAPLPRARRAAATARKRAANDGQTIGVKRRLNSELESARMDVDDAKEGDTRVVDATQMAAEAAAGADRGTKCLLHVALAARDGTHIPDIQNTTALVTEVRQLIKKTPGGEAQPARSAISVPIIGTSRAICVAFNGESEARASLEHYAGGGVLQLPAPDDITITFVALDASEWGKQAEARETQATTESDGLIAIRTATSSFHVMWKGSSSGDQKPWAGAWHCARSTAAPQPRSEASVWSSRVSAGRQMARPTCFEPRSSAHQPRSARDCRPNRTPSRERQPRRIARSSCSARSMKRPSGTAK